MGGSTATILIRGARQLLTLRGPKSPRRGSELNQLSITPDGSLLIQDGLLVEVGPTRRVENLALARQAIEVSATGRVVMPGFIDCHTHLFCPGPGQPLEKSSAAVKALHATSGMRLQRRTRLILEAMARHGTTTVEVKTGCGADEPAEMKILRVLSNLQNQPLEIVPSFLFCPPESTAAEAAESAWHWACSEFLPKIRRRGRAVFADVSASASASPACLSHFFRSARSAGLPCKFHAEQAPSPGAVSLAIAENIVSIDHLDCLSARDLELLSRSAVLATLLPPSCFHQEAAWAPGRTLVDAGASIALGTNFNPTSSPTLSMQTAVQLACRYMELTPEEAISAATINAAHALGRASSLGSLEFGKSADLLILNVSDYRELPHQLGSNAVHMTMKRGQFIYEEGEVGSRPAEDLQPSW